MTPSESGAATSADDVVREQKQERPIVQQDIPVETTETTETESVESEDDSSEETEDKPKRKGLRAKLGL